MWILWWIMHYGKCYIMATLNPWWNVQVEIWYFIHESLQWCCFGVSVIPLVWNMFCGTVMIGSEDKETCNAFYSKSLTWILRDRSFIFLYVCMISWFPSWLEFYAAVYSLCISSRVSLKQNSFTQFCIKRCINTWHLISRAISGSQSSIGEGLVFLPVHVHLFGFAVVAYSVIFLFGLSSCW